MMVKDLMTTQVVSVRKSDSLAAAAQAMWDCDCGSIPVKDDESEQIVGMITDRDICMATWSKDRPPSDIRIAEAASRELYACSPEDSVASAQELMCTKQVRRVPVLDPAGTLVGILSLADIATESPTASTRTSASEVGPVEIASTLRNICKPRNHQEHSAAGMH